MSFLEHLEELRWRLIKALLGVVAGAVVCGLFIDLLVDGMLLKPVADANATLPPGRAPITLQNLKPFGQEFLYMQIALAGGVGGAKLADGLAQVLPPSDLTVIVNTGDDFVHLGLNISPDLDTVCYTLAGLANPATGWGRLGESWNVLESLEALGGPAWFRIGDREVRYRLKTGGDFCSL